MPSSITFMCQTITPMLMHGADGSTAELRPASIKGVLRFWWRAIHGNLSLEKLHEKEGEIFGSTEGRSKLIIFPIEITETKNYLISPTPHHQEGYCSKDDESKNCFSFNEKTKICKKAKKKTAQLYTFTLKMMIKENDYMNKEQLRNLFILATTLGGFGQRSRRGFGSVKITKIDDTDFTPPTTEQEIKAKIADTFKYTSQIKYPYIKKIEIGHNPNNMDELLKKISQATHDTRELDKNLSKEEKVQKQLLDYTFGSANPRYASPIYVSILKFDDKDYRPVITTLKNTKPDNNNEKVTLFKGAING